MKKIIKNPLFTFLLSAVIFGGLGAIIAVSIPAGSVTYSPADTSWQGINTVEKALNSLKSSVGTYNSSSVTPSTTVQNLQTKGKVASTDITVAAIPSEYKKLNATTVEPKAILAGKTAYNGQGQLITGTGTRCVSGSVPVTSSINTSSGLNLNTSISPTMFMVAYFSYGVGFVDVYVKSYNSNNYYEYKWNNAAGSSFNISTYYNLSGKLNVHGYSTQPSSNSTAYYLACE